jgi:phosphoserine phosphatase RsbU/P
METEQKKEVLAELSKFDIKVLLIDDQRIVGISVKKMLSSEEDIIFHYCQEPTKALEMALEIEPTLILQDLVMPDIDGLTMVKFFRANPKLKDIPLIVLSSTEDPETKAEAFALGANDYIVKLPDKIELIARIRYHSQGYINLLERNEAYNALVKSRQELQNDLDFACAYVVSLLPDKIEEGQGPITTDWKFVSSTSLGGDAFGYYWLDDDHFVVYLLDVCGHGVGAALLSVSALNVIKFQTLPNTDFREPQQVISALNETFLMEKHKSLYFTLWYGVYNKNTKELKYTSGGHPPALLYDGDGGIKELNITNCVVGGFEGFPFKSSSVTLNTPCRLYVFSDGVYEVTDYKTNEMWELIDLKNFLEKLPEDGSSEFDNLYTTIQKVSNIEQLDDDFSILKLNIE